MSNVRKMGINISFRGLSWIVAIAASFFVFPFVVRHVGKECYGVYLMVMSITGYLGMLDLGVMSALTKYVSEYNGKKESGKVNKIIDASFSFYVLIGIIIGALLLLFARYFFIFFKIDSSNVKNVKDLFMTAALSALFVWPLNTFRGAVQGLNLWNVDAMVNISVQILNALAAFILLSLGYGIVQLFIVSQLLTILGGVFLYGVTKKRLNTRIIFPYVDMATFKIIFNFSVFMFLGSVIFIFVFQIHNIIIGYFVSVSAITVYAVAYNIQSYFRGINSTLGAPPWTVASEMEGRGDYEGQRKLLFKGTKYTSAVFLPIVFIMFFFAGPFIRYWMGPDFNDSIMPARIIILFWIFNGTAELATGMLSAKGIIKKPLLIHLATAAMNIIIGLSMIKALGITAMAIGLTLSMVAVSTPLLLRLSLKSLNITFREYYDEAIRKNLPLYAIVILLSAGVLTYIYPKNLYMTLGEMAAIYFGSGSLYYLAIINKHERIELLKLVGLKAILARGV